jgi:hypothetical protein
MVGACRAACRVGCVASYMVTEEGTLFQAACMGYRHCPPEGVLVSVHKLVVLPL